MPQMKLGRKLKPARKVWKSLTSKLQRKLSKLKDSKLALKKTTKKLNNTILSALTRPSRPNYKKRSSSSSSSSSTAHSLGAHRGHRRVKGSFAPVYIDDLFKDYTVKAIEAPAKTSKAMFASEKGAPSHQTGEENIEVWSQLCDDHEPILMSPSSSPNRVDEKGAPSSTSDGSGLLTEVDERAERFIAEFRREMTLQRQRSFKEYQEMLERSVM